MIHTQGLARQFRVKNEIKVVLYFFFAAEPRKRSTGRYPFRPVSAVDVANAGQKQALGGLAAPKLSGRM
jgi:hypothetical protein